MAPTTAQAGAICSCSASAWRRRISASALPNASSEASIGQRRAPPSPPRPTSRGRRKGMPGPNAGAPDRPRLPPWRHPPPCRRPCCHVSPPRQAGRAEARAPPPGEVGVATMRVGAAVSRRLTSSKPHAPRSWSRSRRPSKPPDPPRRHPALARAGRPSPTGPAAGEPSRRGWLRPPLCGQAIRRPTMWVKSMCRFAKCDTNVARNPRKLAEFGGNSARTAMKPTEFGQCQRQLVRGSGRRPSKLGHLGANMARIH